MEEENIYIAKNAEVSGHACRRGGRARGRAAIHAEVKAADLSTLCTLWIAFHWSRHWCRRCSCSRASIGAIAERKASRRSKCGRCSCSRVSVGATITAGEVKGTRRLRLPKSAAEVAGVPCRVESRRGGVEPTRLLRCECATVPVSVSAEHTAGFTLERAIRNLSGLSWLRCTPLLTKLP